MDKLKPCPFCGSEARFSYCEDDCCGAMIREVMCSNEECLAEIYVGETKDEYEAAKAWNTRHTPTEETGGEHSVDDVISLKTAMTKLGLSSGEESNHWTGPMFLSGVRRVLNQVRAGIYQRPAPSQPTEEQMEDAMREAFRESGNAERYGTKWAVWSSSWNACCKWALEERK
jgi:hypothetical protein